MSDGNPPALGLLPKLVIGIVIALLIAGVLLHGIAVQVFERVTDDLLNRPDGPMRFRVVLQPCMATIAAVLDGIKDARAGRAPYFWAVAAHSQERVDRLREGLTATARIILLGIAMDVVYQILVFKTFYPAEAVIFALVLCVVPYVVFRGPATRIARHWFSSPADKV